MLFAVAKSSFPPSPDVEVFAIPFITIVLTVVDWRRRKRLKLKDSVFAWLKAFFISLGVAYGVFDALLPSLTFALTVGLNGSNLTLDQVHALDLGKAATVTVVGMLISIGWAIATYLDLGREEGEEASHK